jgi:hypothetical protein
MFCNLTKEFVSQHGIAFEEREVGKDEATLDEPQGRNLMTTPLTLIDDEVVVGFDKAKLAKLLGINLTGAEFRRDGRARGEISAHVQQI